jgi:hypothetical protein
MGLVRLREHTVINMNRINTAALSISTIAGIIAIATACASGGDDPEGEGGSGNTAGTSAGGTNSGGSSTAGSSSGGTSAAGTSNAGASNAGTSNGGSSAGGTNGGGMLPATSVCAAGNLGTRVLPAEEGFIDNFEDTTRFEGWYSYAAATSPSAFAAVAGGALSTGNAGHVANTGVNAGAEKFGAGLGFNLRGVGDICADISNFDGVSFWAKGSAGTANKFKLLAVVPSQADNGAGKGDCDLDAGPCYNHPGKEFIVEANWTHYTIAFSDLTGPVPIVANTVLALQWIVIPSGTMAFDYEFSIDEVTLYTGTAPTGPVSPPDSGGAGGAGGAGGSAP